MAASQSKIASMEKVTTSNQSLHELIIRHPELVIHPLRWTARHLELLNCKFKEIDIPPEAEIGSHEECTVQSATELANNPWSKGSDLKTLCFWQLFNRERGRLVNYCSQTSFYFSGHSRHRPHCEVYFPEEDENNVFPDLPCWPLEDQDEEDEYQFYLKTRNPIVGFVPYSRITQRREERCYPHQHHDRPGNAQPLWGRRIRDCAPKTWFQDPYLVCVMISLAQRNWTDDRCYEFYTVRLVVCHDDENDYAYVYYAEFPKGILDQLDKPVSRTEANWPTIYYTKIPFEPYGTFRDRMEMAMMDAKVGTTEGGETGYKSVEVENPNATAEASNIGLDLGIIDLSTTKKGLMN